MTTPSVTANQIIQIAVQGLLVTVGTQAESELVKVVALGGTILLACAMLIADAIIRFGRSKHL